MTKDELDILRKIANQLERIADALTGEHIEEMSLAELQYEEDKRKEQIMEGYIYG